MAKLFDVNKATIRGVFIEPKCRYEIPRFQRQYSWVEQNIEEFWETLCGKDPVFLGTVIFNNRKKDDQNIVEIIDGQQRYLTIQILGAVIRDYLLNLTSEYKDDESLEKIAKGINRKLIGSLGAYEDAFTDDSFVNYLIPGDSIRNFFSEYIQDFSGPNRISEELTVKRGSERERVKKAYLKFRELLVPEVTRRVELAEKKAFLRDLVDVMLGRHFFALIEIDDESLAYEIFETVNAKGVDLNVADLIKNQIFSHVVGSDGKYEDAAKERWKEIEEKVGSCANVAVKDFLSWYWTSKYGYVPDRTLYRTIQEHFKKSEGWNQFLSDLVLNADLLNDIFNGDLEDLLEHFGDIKEARRVHKSLLVLRNIKGAKVWVILYLCLFRNLSQKHGTPPNIPLKLDKRWDIIARFTFLYYQVLALPGNWYHKLIRTITRRIEESVNAKKTQQTYIELFSKELFAEFYSKLPKTFDIFEEGFAGIRYNKNDQNSRIIVRYILAEIDEHLAGKVATGFDPAKVNIEHIVPQQSSKWKLTAKEIKPYVHTLGNLLIVSEKTNSAMGNEPFEVKFPELCKSSHIFLVKEFVEKVKSKEWRFDLIESKDFSGLQLRNRKLAEYGFTLWVTDLRKLMGYGN